MADINAQSVEDYADRIVYRYRGGRYDQVLTGWIGAFPASLLTLLNTDTARTYVVPRSGLPAKFFKIELSIYTAAYVTEIAAGVGLTLVKASFFRVNIPTLNFDGKSQITEFYSEKNEQYYTSPQLRAINIGNIQVEPIIPYSDLLFTPGITTPQFNPAGATTGITAIIQPTVTYYKK